MGQRVTVLAVATALVAAGGTALADNLRGDAAGNRLVGTEGRDNISGAGGGDHVFGAGGGDHVFGKGSQDRLFGDSGGDDVHGGDGRDRLQGSLGQDDLYGQAGNDFVNAIDGQVNDSVDCGEGENDVAGIDGFFFGQDSDQIAENCENLYLAIPGGVGVRVGGERATTDLVHRYGRRGRAGQGGRPPESDQVGTPAVRVVRPGAIGLPALPLGLVPGRREVPSVSGDGGGRSGKPNRERVRRAGTRRRVPARYVPVATGP